MTDISTPSKTVELNADGKPKIPSGINVLTILTFIGCGIGLLLTLLSPAIYKFSLSFLEKAQASSGRELTTKELTDLEKNKAVIELSQANLVPLMAIGLVGIALCLVGAIWMRKLKKDGFWIYTGGELLPLIGSFVLLGVAQFTNPFSAVFAIGVPVLFIILYSRQRKYLVN